MTSLTLLVQILLAQRERTVVACEKQNHSIMAAAAAAAAATAILYPSN
jgi:hypothetical protein